VTGAPERCSARAFMSWVYFWMVAGLRSCSFRWVTYFWISAGVRAGAFFGMNSSSFFGSFILPKLGDRMRTAERIRVIPLGGTVRIWCLAGFHVSFSYPHHCHYAYFSTSCIIYKNGAAIFVQKTAAPFQMLLPLFNFV